MLKTFTCITEGYAITNKDTSLLINHYNSARKLLNQIKYIKVPKNSESALQYIKLRLCIAVRVKLFCNFNQFNIKN